MRTSGVKDGRSYVIRSTRIGGASTDRNDFEDSYWLLVSKIFPGFEFLAVINCFNK